MKNKHEKTIHNYIYNSILNNIIYDLVYNWKKIKFSICNNDITINYKDNNINYSINWINTSKEINKTFVNDYENFIQAFIQWLDVIITFYLMDCYNNNYNDNEILEMWQE